MDPPKLLKTHYYAAVITKEKHVIKCTPMLHDAIFMMEGEKRRFIPKVFSQCSLIRNRLHCLRLHRTSHVIAFMLNRLWHLQDERRDEGAHRPMSYITFYISLFCQEFHIFCSAVVVLCKPYGIFNVQTCA
jgi:hypothetical protein